MSSEVRRKLTTILAADAAGYSKAMDADEVSTLGELRAARSIFAKFIERHDGRIVNTAGDGLIAEFPSVVEAVQCAIEVQHELGNHGRDQAGALRFRIGIHLGDVMIDGTDLLGEGVNLAARLETMAEPGGVLISQQVYDQVQHKLSVGFEYLGEKRPKNFTQDVSVYRISKGKRRRDKWRKKPSTDSHDKNNEEPEVHSFRQSDSSSLATENLRDRTVRQATLFAGLILVLLVIDLVTGGPFWAHWPGLALATIIGLKAAPLFVRGWFKVSYVRGIVIVGALALVNLFTWIGYPWVLWPAAVLIMFELLRQLGVRPK